MSAYANSRDDQFDKFGSGFAGAIVLHLALVGIIIAAAYLAHIHTERWGENTSIQGAIQASMVSAIPLPSKVPPVEHNVLTPDNPTVAPAPPPKEATQPPPKPTDVLIKAKTPVATKTAPTTTEAPPKHPQPTPDTAKATTGEAASQIPQSVAQAQNGTASLTVQDRAFGSRYAYYLQAVSRVIAQNWFTQEANPRASQGKSVKLTFDIQRDGTPINVRIETPSGSATLDTSAIRAVQRVDGFGPLPAGNQLTVEDTFNYHAP